MFTSLQNIGPGVQKQSHAADGDTSPKGLRQNDRNDSKL